MPSLQKKAIGGGRCDRPAAVFRRCVLPGHVGGSGTHLQSIATFRFRDGYTFVYNGEMTLAGPRGSSVAQRIVEIGAVNQLQADVVALMLGRS